MAEELYTIPQARQILKTGNTKTYQLLNSGALKAVKIGKKTLVPKSSVEAFIASLQPYNTGV